MSRWAGPLARGADELVAAGVRHSALARYADDIEARIAAGDSDPDLPDEARAARARAIQLEGE